MSYLYEGRFIDYHGARLFVPEEHFASEALLRGATPEGHVYHVFRQILSKGDKVVDIGANIGFHTFAMASLVGSSGTVFAIEADVANAACLQSSVNASNSDNVLVICGAASDRVGLLHLLSSDRTNNIFTGFNNGIAKQVVNCLRVDDIIDETIKMIKIDIEGSELLALKGAQNLIDKFRPHIVTEFSEYYIQRTLGSNRSIEYLSIFFDRGYSCKYIHPESRLISLPDLQAVINCQREALEKLNWGHIDLLFIP